MAYAVEDIDAALQADPEYQQADASVQRKWRANALKDAGLSTQARTEPSAPSNGMGVMDVAAGIAPPELAQKVGSFVKPSILPTVGSIGVPAAATALLGPANAPFVPLESGIGSGLGEAANQALGITEPSLAQIGLSAALPTALGYGANAVRAGKQFLGAKGAETLNQLAPEEAKRMVGSLRGSENVGQLFKDATAQGVKVPAKQTASALDDLLTQMGNPSVGIQKARGKVEKYLVGLRERLTTQSGNLTPTQLQAELQGIGELQREAAAKGGPTAGAYKKLFGALSDDLEGAPALKHARDVFKRETVLNDLDDAVNAAFKINRGQGEAAQFNANKVLNTLQDATDGMGKFFHQAFTKAERKDVTDLFKFLNTIPNLAPGAGQQFGAGRAIAKTLGPIAAGSGAGFAMGGPAGSGIGAAVGAILPPVADTGKMMLQAWRMPGGRNLIKSLLSNSDGSVTPQVLQTLGAFVSGQMAEAGLNPNTMESQSTGSLEPPGMTVRPFALAQ